MVELSYRGTATWRCPPGSCRARPTSRSRSSWATAGRRRPSRQRGGVRRLPLRASDAPGFRTGAEASKTGETYILACCRTIAVDSKAARGTGPGPRGHARASTASIPTSPRARAHARPRRLALSRDRGVRLPDHGSDDRLPGRHELRLGDGHRPEYLHRLQRLRGGLPGREQHSGRRQGPGLAAARCTGCGRPYYQGGDVDNPRPIFSPGSACTARRRRARWSAR